MANIWQKSKAHNIFDQRFISIKVENSNLTLVKVKDSCSIKKCKLKIHDDDNQRFTAITIKDLLATLMKVKDLQ